MFRAVVVALWGMVLTVMAAFVWCRIVAAPPFATLGALLVGMAGGYLTDRVVERVRRTGEWP